LRGRSFAASGLLGDIDLVSSIRPLLAVAVAALACATFSESHRDRWAMVRVENLTVYTNLRDYPEATVAAFVRARQIIGTLFLDVPGKVEVLLFDEPAAAPGPRLFEYAGQVNVPKPRGIVLSGVQGLDGSRGVIVTLDKPMGSSPLHLMAHRLTGEALPGAPVWLHEGFAMLMDTAWLPRRIGKQQALCFGFRGVTSFRLLPFDELLAADRARAAGTNPWDFAASAFVLVDYLYSGEGGRIRLLPGARRDAPRSRAPPMRLLPARPVARLERRRRHEDRPRARRLRCVRGPGSAGGRARG
jgi:hypothetical protein